VKASLALDGALAFKDGKGRPHLRRADAFFSTAVFVTLAGVVAWDEILADARRQNPGIIVPDHAFIEHASRFLGPSGSVEGLRAGDLYLACAASRGDARAVTRISEDHFVPARSALARLDGIDADDVLQSVRETLFVAGKIASYAGRGDLAKWIRTIAMRTAMDQLGPKREIATPQERIASFDLPIDDAQVELMKREYGVRFREAFAEAVAALPSEARGDLRAYYLDGRGLAEMALAAGVAVSTVSRRIARARELLLQATRDVLLAKLGVGEAELDSILRVIETRLDVSRGAFERVDDAVGDSDADDAEDAE